MRLYHLIILAVLVTIIPFISAPTYAADFPNKDIHIIVPFDAGGGVDTTSRIIAKYANKILKPKGVKIVVENRTGGGGVVGQTYAANAKPNGYTVLAMTSSVVTNPKIKYAQYELSDLQPVALYNLDPEVLVVPKSSSYKTISDLTADARDHSLNMVLASPGTSHHMAALALMHRSDLKFTLLHMDDFSQQVQAVVGDHADLALWPLGEAKKHIESGTVRLLAVSSLDRLSDYPDVPTWQEAGLGIKQFITFRGWAVPKGTPGKAIQFLSKLLAKVNKNPAYRKAMMTAGYQPSYRDTADFSKVIENYDDLSAEIIDAYGLSQKK